MNRDVGRPRALEVENLAFRYRRRTVLSDVNLSLGVGTNVVLGRNGAGKTTLIRVLAGAAAPASGVIRLGSEALKTNERQGRSLLRHIGWLPQEFGYPPHMTSSEYVAYAAWLKEVPKDRILAQVSESLAAVDLVEQARRPLRELSGGQLRRVGLAAAVVADPAVLILDEPTAGLDPEQRDSFHAMIRKLQTDKVVVVATHLLEDVEAVAEHIVVVDAGTVRWEGTPEQIADVGGGTPGMQGLRQGLRAVLGSV